MFMLFACSRKLADLRSKSLCFARCGLSSESSRLCPVKHGRYQRPGIGRQKVSCQCRENLASTACKKAGVLVEIFRL